ncbi:MAG TPA: amidohydrolase family protein [Allosphingosinicella sp.]|nr:amidohydrolase family protein [Allosphingosinicella sp.]
MNRSKLTACGLALAALASGSAFGSAAANAQQAERESITPVIAHHQHLLSPTMREAWQPRETAIELPAELAHVLRERERISGNNDPSDIYSEDALFVRMGERSPWDRGNTTARSLAAKNPPMARFIPIGYSSSVTSAYLAGVVRIGDGEDVGNFVLGLVKGVGGKWQIAVENITPKAPATYTKPILAADLIRQMDDAGVRRGVILSVGYSYSSPSRQNAPGEYELVRGENDWTGGQAALFPNRLVAFCGVNPLRDYAVREVERCATTGRFKGTKLHFANSRVDLENPEHVKKVRAFFAAANRFKMPIAVHLWTLDPKYGAAHSRIFMREILPAAPNIPIQIAHMAGAGTYVHDDALEVFSDAVARKERLTRNLYFDLTGTIDEKTPEAKISQLVTRLRQIGVERLLFGSDMHPNPDIKSAWAIFRGRVSLTDAEIRAIADNEAPYMRAR